MVMPLVLVEPLRMTRSRRHEVIIKQTCEEHDFLIPTLRIEEVLNALDGSGQVSIDTVLSVLKYPPPLIFFPY